MLGPVVSDLEEWLGSQLSERASIRLDPACVDEQRRRHPLLSQRFDQFRVIVAARPAATRVQGEATTRSVVGSRDITRGTASPQAVGCLPEYRRIRALREVRSVPTGPLGVGSGATDTAGTLAGAGTELTGGVGSRCTRRDRIRRITCVRWTAAQDSARERPEQEGPALDVQTDPPSRPA